MKRKLNDPAGIFDACLPVVAVSPAPEQEILSGVLRHHAGIKHASPIILRTAPWIDLPSRPFCPWNDPCIRLKTRRHAMMGRAVRRTEVLP